MWFVLLIETVYGLFFRVGSLVEFVPLFLSWTFLIASLQEDKDDLIYVIVKNALPFSHLPVGIVYLSVSMLMLLYLRTETKVA